MASVEAEIQALNPINQDDFKKGLDIYANYLGNQDVAKACKDFFAQHIIKTYEKESKNMPKVTFLPNGKINEERYFSNDVEELKKLGIDVIAMVNASSLKREGRSVVRHLQKKS